MNLAELRGWVEERREDLAKDGLEKAADFLVRLLVDGRMKGREYTMETCMLELLEFSCRKSLTAKEEKQPKADREVVDGSLQKAIILAKMLGLSSEKIAGALLQATYPLRKD